MNWGKIKRKLEREFKRSPGKTCVLLALLPVGVYFVGPLLWKSIPNKRATPGAAQAQQSAGFLAPTAQSTPVAGGSATALLPWHQVVAAIARDARMKPAPLSGIRNPFQDHQPSEKPSEQTAAVEPEPSDPAFDMDVRPEDMGLRLTATIVGPRVRLATINGRQYRENATLLVGTEDGADDEPSNGDQSSMPSFLIRSVGKKHVVLERKGKLYQLKLER